MDRVNWFCGTTTTGDVVYLNLALVERAYAGPNGKLDVVQSGGSQIFFDGDDAQILSMHIRDFATASAAKKLGLKPIAMVE